MPFHPTVSITGVSDRVIGIVLVGPPASGKSTVCDIFSDIGVPVVDVAGLDPTPRKTKPSEWVQAVYDGARNASDVGVPPVVVIDGVSTQEEVDEIDDRLPRGVLVIRVDTETAGERTDRYVERELGTDRDVVATDDIYALREELYERERQELPYPQHAVEIINGDSVSMIELTVRLDDLVTALA